ncbi:hypothetical protein AAFG07_33645 [Bradyrhizobium sp. B097]|uniref:hypothetical protein n=1 Tax=Bradyrhizobium sp. B097 TaxID=3140244 RepID=UPI00318451FE
MPNFITTYDLVETRPDPHETFLEKAMARGWSVWKKGSDGRLYRLPNTTLTGSFANQDLAVAALKATRADTQRELGVKVSMEKWIVAQYSGSVFASDEKERP